MNFGGPGHKSMETVRRSVTMSHAHRKADSCQVPMWTEATWSFFRTMGHKIGTPLWLKASAMIWVTQPTLKPSSSSGTTAMPWAFRPIISRVSRTGKSRVCVSPRWRKRWEIIRSFWPRVEFFRSTSGA